MSDSITFTTDDGERTVSRDDAPAIKTTRRDDTYAWAECPKCGNTLKFGVPGSMTVCPACSLVFQEEVALPKTDPAQECAARILERIVTGDRFFDLLIPVQQDRIATIIRRHFPATPEGSEFEGHTPGPWTWGTNDATDSIDSNFLVVRPLGEFPHGLWVADCGRDGDIPALKNAQLIAAAPGLLAERDALRAEVARLRPIVQAIAWSYDAEQRDLKPILTAGSNGMIPHDTGQAARAALSDK